MSEIPRLIIAGSRHIEDKVIVETALQDGKSRGTRSMIELAKDRGLLVFVYNISGDGTKG